jgi:hypothetical protein
MGFQKRWDVEDIQRQLGACSAQMNSNYNDGFIQWGCKQDLLVVKYQLDELLRSSPKFAGEDEFVDQLDKQLVWKRLNEKTN